MSRKSGWFFIICAMLLVSGFGQPADDLVTEGGKTPAVGKGGHKGSVDGARKPSSSSIPLNNDPDGTGYNADEEDGAHPPRDGG